MRTGDTASLRRTFSAKDVADWQALTGDTGLPPAFVPEPLIGALFSCLLGVTLPGPGTNYLKQRTAYLSAIPVGVEVVATVRIKEIRPDKRLVDLETLCMTGGTIAAQGRALVYVQDVVGTPDSA
jgi:3-hydroxybutyryl-CoA dehydratase